MNYQVFARKWRPKKFSDIIGQEHIVAAIINSFKLNRVHHAYILSGIRGIGKTTLGRLLAKGLNCIQKSQSDVCGQCKVCMDIESGCFIDLIEIDAASRTKVEDTRDFLDNVQYAPSQGQFKIYLIDEVHMLSRHSFNALLKTLEEPPKHVKFILITTEHQKIPETILSRCLQFCLKPLNIFQITTQLIYICKQENIKIIDEHALELLACASKGSIRDSLNLLEQAILLGNNSIRFDIISNMLGILHTEHSVSLIENLVDKNINNIMLQIDHYSSLGINWDLFFEGILTVFQKIAMIQFLPISVHNRIDSNKIQDVIKKRIYSLCDRITPENVQLYYQIFLLGRKELPYAPSGRMGLEIIVLRALAFAPINLNIHDSCHNDTTSLVNFNVNQNSLQKTKNNLELQKSKDICTNINIDTEQKSRFIDSNDIIPNSTIKTLEAREKLVKYQLEHNKMHENIVKKNICHMPQNITEKILERFSNIVKNNSIDDSHNVKKK